MRAFAAICLGLLCASCSAWPQERRAEAPAPGQLADALIPLSRGTAGQLGMMGMIAEIGGDAAVIVTNHGSGAYLHGLVLCVKQGAHRDVQQFYPTVLSHGGEACPQFVSYDGQTLALYNAERKRVASVTCGAVRVSAAKAAEAKLRLGKECIKPWAWEFPGMESVGRELIREAGARYCHRDAGAELTH